MRTMLFGPLGHMQPIPYPETGLDAPVARKSETTDLVSGGVSVYRAPTSHRSYRLTWKGGTGNLGHLLDCYDGLYGDGPFYFTEFMFSGGNLLPSRWASGHLLRHVNERWCAPVEVDAPAALSGKASQWHNNSLHPEFGITQTVVPAPGLPVYLRVWGSATGGATIQWQTLAAGVWGAWADVTPSATPAGTLLAAADAVEAVRLRLRVPVGGTLTVDHINLTTADTGTRAPGRGIGGVYFTDDYGVNIISKLVDRIGAVVNIIEAEE